ncbi:MAG TPA: CPBP family intramembrane glutamic endopeptidase [Thermoanaerobaculia bacterium]
MALTDHLEGHAFLFDAKKRPSVGRATALRLLLIYLVLEIAIGPRLHLARAFDLPLPPLYVTVPLLLVVALLLVRRFASFEQIGLYRWREWSTTEKSYFLQIVIAINISFALLYRAKIEAIADWGNASIVFATYFVWGFYQEVIYRGILQTALVAKWGAWAGVLVANLLFTFGPLHLYHLAGGPSPAMFISIFAIGLFFGVLRQRSDNLWIPAVFHGIGDCYFTALGTLSYSSSA